MNPPNIMKPPNISRRAVLSGAAYVAFASALSACTSEGSTSSPADSNNVLNTPPGSDSLDTTVPAKGRLNEALAAVSADRGTKLQSLYLPMQDGTRIAIDLWLPDGAGTESVPTVMRSTRYQRAVATKDPSPEKNPNAEEATNWGKYGYALVVVDARGSGASFGTRRSELSDAEVMDYGEVINWIGNQPWSNSRVGTYGVSYDGNTAEHAARTSSPHLAAIAPQFSDFDPFRQTIFPGGAYFAPFDQWLGLTRIIDGLDGAVETYAEAVGATPEQVRSQFPGVAPVDPKLLPAAIAEHQTNVAIDLRTLDYRDDPRWEASSVGTHRDAIETSGVAVFVQAGWFDAATSVGTLERFATFNTSQDVWLGPWNHGGGQAYDPTTAATLTGADLGREDQFARLLDFFDQHVKNGNRPNGKKVLRFTTINQPGWTETDKWPLPDVSDRTFTVSGATLLETSDAPPTAETNDAKRLELPGKPHTTGSESRWIGQLGGTPVNYGTWANGAESRLSFTGTPLTADLVVCGFPIVKVDVESSDSDGVIHAYLEMVKPDGTTVPISEGQLRLSHRGKTQPPVISSAKLERSFAKPDQQPMKPGTVESVVFEMVPISARFDAGSRLQLSFAGSDTDNFDLHRTESSSLWLHVAPTSLSLVLPTRTTS